MKNAIITFVLFCLLKAINGQTPEDTLPSLYLKSHIGFLIGTVESEMKAPFSFMSDINVRASKVLHAGMGSGLEFFQTTYIPIYLVISAKPFTRHIVFFCSGGYTFPLNKRVNFKDGYNYQFSAGYFVNPELTYIFCKPVNRHAFLVGIGYRYQRTDAKRLEPTNNYWPYNPSYDYTLITVLNRFSLRVGYIFF
ncbi:MAG: hypothetical protein ACP5PZ_10530 [Bacteroidales bacterium]